MLFDLRQISNRPTVALTIRDWSQRGCGLKEEGSKTVRLLNEQKSQNSSRVLPVLYFHFRFRHPVDYSVVIEWRICISPPLHEEVIIRLSVKLLAYSPSSLATCDFISN